MEDYTKKPWWVLAAGLALGLALAGLGLAIYLIIEASGSVALNFPKGFLWTLVTGGTEVGAVVVTGATTVVVIKQVVQNAMKNPYAWVLPVLAILSAFLIDDCKDLLGASRVKTESGFSEGLEKNLYGCMAALSFLIAGITWRMKTSKSIKPVYNTLINILFRCAAIFLFLLPVGFLYFIYSRNHPGAHVWDEMLINMNPDVILMVAAFLFLCLIAVLISWKSKDIA